MLNSPTVFVAYCSLTGKVRAFTRCVGISDSPATPRQLRPWPALLAHVERLRGTHMRDSDTWNDDAEICQMESELYSPWRTR